MYCGMHFDRLRRTGNIGPSYPLRIHRPFTDDDDRHGTRAGHDAHKRNGTTSCPPCRKAVADDTTARRDRLRAIGLCPRCGKRPPAPGRTICDECKTTQRTVSRRHVLWKNFGLTPDAFEAMWTSQQGRCAICNNPLERRTHGYAVDHDHDTGTVRQLLCGQCNYALGAFQDSIHIVQAALDYLKKHAYVRPAIRLRPPAEAPQLNRVGTGTAQEKRYRPI